MLPTDSRFRDLTEEQLDLIYEHYNMDNPPRPEMSTKKRDNSEPDHERYYDPDFDEVWGDTDENESKPANGVDTSPLCKDLPSEVPEGENVLLKNGLKEQWEEV